MKYEKKYTQVEGLQKKSQSWRMGAPKNLRGGGCSKGMQVLLKGGLETPNKLCHFAIFVGQLHWQFFL